MPRFRPTKRHRINQRINSAATRCNYCSVPRTRTIRQIRRRNYDCWVCHWFRFRHRCMVVINSSYVVFIYIYTSVLFWYDWFIRYLTLLQLARELQVISDPYYCTACLYPTLSATVSVRRDYWWQLSPIACSGASQISYRQIVWFRIVSIEDFCNKSSMHRLQPYHGRSAVNNDS